MVEGGAGAGMVGWAQTVSCSNCKELFDLGGYSEEGRSGFDPSRELQCQRCKKGKLLAWSRQDGCPRCGGEMKEELSVLWD
jgi:hypothetical protein